MSRRRSNTQWFILEIYRQILPLSVTCLFYILAGSWNLEPSQDFSTTGHSSMAYPPFPSHEDIRWMCRYVFKDNFQLLNGFGQWGAPAEV